MPGRAAGPLRPTQAPCPRPSLPSQAAAAYVTPGREQGSKAGRGMAGQASAPQQGGKAARLGGLGAVRDPDFPGGAV
jgi:hypothetical protein